MLFATFLVVVFAYLLLSPASVYAASDATWQDDKTILYDGRTYQGPIVKQASDTLPGVPDGAVVFVDLIKDQKKGSVLFFAPSESESYLNNATSATLINYGKYTGGENGLPEFSDPGNPEEVPITPRAPPEEPTNSCDLDGIGWIICPVSKAIAESMDFLYGVITKFFEVSLLTTNNSSLYRMWDIARSIANVLFVVGFLIMIYGQITGGLLSNYTIKKLLPRLIIAAILVNLSYWICALGVDLSNILGFSIQNMFESLRAIAGAPNSAAANTATPTWANVSAGVLAGGGAVLFGASAVIIASGTGVGLAMLLLSALIPAIFAAIVAVAVLAARQALITIFIIISPLAFVAYLLPNTEEWFTRWRKLFMNMLIMFPAFSVIFGGAQLAGTLIIQNTDSIIVVILGMTVQIVPLFITPFLIKLSSGLLSAIANITNDKSKGVFDRTKNWADTRRGQEQARGRMQRDQRAKRLGFQDGRRQYNSRLRRGLARTNPNNLAYYRDYRRREREAMKTANESMSEGLFTQTAAGRRIYTRSHDAEAEKHYGESTNFEGYKTAMATGNDRQNVYRRQLHHEAHLAKGRGDIYEESLTAHAERDLREQIRDTPTLADVKIRTTVDSGLAEEAKKLVDARGSHQLQETVLASSALRQQARLIHEYEGRAAQARELIDDGSKAAWQRLTLNDQTIYSRQLERQANAKQLKSLQDEWESILVEASAGRTDDYVGRFGSTTPEIASSIQTIQASEQIIAAESRRKANAEHEFKYSLTKQMKADEALLKRAAGISEQGKWKVLSQLSKEGSALHMENVEAVESYMTNEGYTLEEEEQILRGGRLRDGSEASDMHRHAALRRILLSNGNNWAAQRTFDYVVSQGMEFDEARNAFIDEDGNVLDDDEISRRRDLQQIYKDADAKSPLKVDYLSGTDKGMAENGILRRRDKNLSASEQHILRDIAQGKIDGDRAFASDIDIIMRQIQIFRDPAKVAALSTEQRTKYIKTLNDMLTDERLGMKMSERNWGATKVIANLLDETDTRPVEEKIRQYVDRRGDTATIEQPIVNLVTGAYDWEKRQTDED